MTHFQDAEEAIFGSPKDPTNNPSMQGVADLFKRVSYTYTDFNEFILSNNTYSDGEYVGTSKEGFSYKAVTSGGDVTNAAGQGFEVLPNSQGVVVFEQWGAVGDWDGVSSGTDDTTAIHQAFASSFTSIWGTDGKYYLTDPVTTVNSTIRELNCNGVFRLYTKVDSSGDVGLDFSSRQFLTIDGVHFYSTGDPNDGNATVGVKTTSCAVLRTGPDVRFFGYSGKALQVIQCVDAHFDRPVINGASGSPVIGISLEKNGSVPCTTVMIDQAYILGCVNAIRSDGTAMLGLNQPIVESSGSVGLSEAALHLIGTSGYILNPYWENCLRNMIREDCSMPIIGKAFGLNSGTVADSVIWTGTAFDDRGTSYLDNTDLKIRRIGPDTDSVQDLVIGENFTAPVAGGSNQFEKMTRESGSGSLSASGVWETITTLTGITAGAETRLRYKYTVRLGNDVNSQGFDSGTIYQGGAIPGVIVFVSDSGTTPTWLRMDGPNLEINSPSASALDYAFELEIVSIG